MDKVEIYRDQSGGDQPWRWRRKAPNGEPISSGESHRDATDAERAARRACPDLPDDAFVVTAVDTGA